MCVNNHSTPTPFEVFVAPPVPFISSLTTMTSEVAMETILQAIENSKTEVMAKLQELDKKVNQLDNKVTSLAEQNVELQQRVSKTEDEVSDAQTRIQKLEKNVASLQTKVDYMENKSRQANLIFVGILECSASINTTAFLQQLIPELLGKENFPEPLGIVRSHRIATRKKDDLQSKPRPIIAKFWRDDDREKIRRLAREKGQLAFKEKRIHIFPDASEAVRAKQRALRPVREKLLALEIRYYTLFPAILCFEHEGIKYKFDSPKEAENFVNEIQVSDRSLPSPMD